jgi:hypothetical protein
LLPLVNFKLYDRGGSETVWRLFDPPFLISSTVQGHPHKPLLVDSERVRITGVIVASLRHTNGVVMAS